MPVLDGASGRVEWTCSALSHAAWQWRRDPPPVSVRTRAAGRTVLPPTWLTLSGPVHGKVGSRLPSSAHETPALLGVLLAASLGEALEARGGALRDNELGESSSPLSSSDAALALRVLPSSSSELKLPTAGLGLRS